MMVTFNYRIGALGFLPSADTAAAGLLSLGLRDQVAAMEWVNEYIEYFGGDKDQVTLMGLSAGATSVGFHMLDYKPGVNPLFHRAIMSSGSPTSFRGYLPANFSLYEEQYREFIERVGCSPGSGVWECLRGVDVTTIDLTQYDIFTYYSGKVAPPFRPVVGGPLIPIPASVAWETGNYYKVPVIVGSVQDEGTMFVPRNLSTNDDYRNFFKSLAPQLTEENLTKIVDLYPDPVTHPDSPYANSFFGAQAFGAQFQRLQTAFGDCTFSCQVEETAIRASQFSPVWKYLFAQNNTFPAWLGIPHGGDMTFQTGEPGTASPRVSSVYTSWLTSFVATGDPNTFAVKEFQGKKTPQWLRYYAEKDVQMRMGPDGDLGLEPKGRRTTECAFWRDLSTQLNR